MENNKSKMGMEGIQPDEFIKHTGALINDNDIKEITGEALLLREVDQIACLVEPFLQKVGLACLAGSSDTGKSTLLRQLAITITTGTTDFLDFKIKATHRSVIYVSTEDLETETAYLLSRQCQNYHPELLKKLRFIFETDNLYSTLDRSLRKEPADLIIMDCFADVFGSDLKDTQRIRNFLHPYQQLAREHQCLILFLHHTGKRTETLEPSKNNLLSGQGFEAKMRLVIELRVDKANPNNRHLCIVKGNYLPASFKGESYVLHFNENDFLFTNTKQRMSYESLVSQHSTEKDKAKYEIANKLKKQGHTYNQIAKELGYVSKGSVSKLFDKAFKNGWDNSNTTDSGQDSNS